MSSDIWRAVSFRSELGHSVLMCPHEKQRKIKKRGKVGIIHSAMVEPSRTRLDGVFVFYDFSINFKI